MSAFCDLFDREQAIWRDGIGDDDRQFAIDAEEGEHTWEVAYANFKDSEGRALEHAWESAYFDLRVAWDAVSRRLGRLEASSGLRHVGGWWRLVDGYGYGYDVRGGDW